MVIVDEFSKFVDNKEYYEEGHRRSKRGAKWIPIVNDARKVLDLIKIKYEDKFVSIEAKFNFGGKRKREDAVAKLIFTEVKKVGFEGLNDCLASSVCQNNRY